MERTETCVIVNPAAGSAGDVDALRQALRRLGPVTMRETGRSGDARREAARAVAQGFGRVVAAGGDGTLGEVVDGLGGGFDGTAGVLPLGTGNDFARSAGVPAEPDGAVAVLAAGRVAAVDVLEVAARGASSRVINAVTGGFSAVIDENLDDTAKEWLGPVAFLVSAGRSLPELRRYRVELTADGGAAETLDAYNIVVSNGRSVGGGVPVAPTALVDDGVAEVTVIPVLPVAELTALVGRLLVGGDDDRLVRRRARRLRIDAQPATALTHDGEVRGTTPVSVAVRPRALRFAVGADAALSAAPAG